MLPAAEAAQSKRAQPARAAQKLSADDAFVAARQAFAQGNLEAFEAAAAQAAGHPLAEYLEYWRLRLRLQRLGPDPSQPEPAQAAAAREAPPEIAELRGLDAQVSAFLVQHRGTIVADLLRRDWLLSLGQRGQWSTFDRQYPQWILRDEQPVHCMAWTSRTLRGEPVPDDARATLFAPRELPSTCQALFDQLARAGTIGRDEVLLRLHRALEANSPASVRKAAALLDLDAGAVERALDAPAKTLASSSGREVATVAIVRLARADPEAAASRLEAGIPALGEADRLFAWSQVAASAMRRLLPEAHDWSRRALDARASDDTRVWLARAALRAHDWPLLRMTIERMSPQGRADPAWVYWRARALQAEGRGPEADELLRSIAGQFHFYGQLAAEELGQLTVAPPRAQPPTEQELDQVSRNAGFARAMKFFELGLRLEGNREWNFQLRGMNDRQLLAAAEWACRRSVLDRCVNTADRTRGEHDFTLRFVSPFSDQLKPVAEERGLDPAWVYGLIRQESRFIMDARSSAGAKGLMQIMPGTARWIARKLGVKDFRVEQLADMPVNLQFGTFYLKSVLDDLEGSPVLATAAYNAGPGRPRNWRSTLPHAVDGAVFAEIIPFAETRDYVKKVLSNATFYAAVFSGEPQSLKARLGSIAPRPNSKTDLP